MDSGGVVITLTTYGADGDSVVTTERRALAEEPQGWSVAPNPAVVFGAGEDPESALGQPVDALRLPNGDVLVADTRLPGIRWYDAAGTYVRTVGRSGEGPGEFRWVSWVEQWTGDSISVYDPGLHRISIFGPDGSFVRAISWGDLAAFEGLSLYRVLAPEVFLTVRWETGGGAPASGLEERESALYVLDVHDTVVTKLPIAWTTSWYWERFQPPNVPFLNIPVPFAPTTETGAGHGLLVSGVTTVMQFDAFDTRGRRVWTLSADTAQRAVTQAERSWAEQSLEHRSSQTAIQQAVRRAMHDMDLARGVPFFGRRAWERVTSTDPEIRPVLIDADRDVWILTYVANDVDPRPWIVLSGEGRWRGEMTLPAGTWPWEIGHDYVLGWREEADGALVVVQHRLEKGSG